MNLIKFILLELTGKEISEKQEKILELIFQELYTFKESELEPPSSMVAFQACICGNKFPQIVASAINCFGEKHGCFSDALKFIKNDFPLDNKRFSGFGHPKYKEEDPRATKIIKYAKELNYKNDYLMKAVNFSIVNNIPINIGGVAACVLLDCGCEEIAADYFLIAARTLGFAKICQLVKSKKIKFGNSYETPKAYNS
jgi:citrate synthase